MECEWNPGAAVTGAGMARTRSPRRRLSPGNQGVDRSAPGLAVRARRVLVLLARGERVLGGGAARQQAHCARASGVRAPGIRLREPDRPGAAAAADGGVRLRAERR